MGNNVKSLIDLAADSAKNMFDVSITDSAILAGIDTNDELRFRAQGFTVKEPKASTYDVDYKTVKIQKPKPKIDLDRTITLKVRLDANFGFYDGFKQLENKVFDGETGFATSKMPDTGDRFTLKCKYLNKAAETVADINDEIMNGRIWKYSDCWVSAINELGFDQKSADPFEIEATIKFGNYEMIVD